MKKLFTMAGLLGLLLSTQVWAFPVPTRVTWTPQAVTSEVYNPYYAPISCWVSVTGYRNDGINQWNNAPMWVMPGTANYSQVWVKYPGLWFVSGYSWADCRF